MPAVLALFAVVLVLSRQPASGDDPRVIVRNGLRAVEGDSVTAVRARWEARLRKDSTDRAALLGLATLARLTYDYPTAERLYRSLVATARLDRYVTFARLGMAWKRDAQGFANDAGAEFERARAIARETGDRTAEGEALLGLSFVRARTAGMKVGLALLDTAARLIPDTTLDLQAERHRRRAMILATLGRPEAVAAVDSTVSISRRAGVVRTEGDGFRGLARALQLRGQVDSEMVALRRAEQLYSKARDRSTLANALIRRAGALLARAELGEAKTLLHLGLREAEASQNLWAVAMTSTQLGKLYIQLNDFVTADTHLKSAATMFQTLGDSGSAMVNREELVWVALAAGDFARARQQALEALDFYRRTDQPSEQFSQLRDLAFIAVRQRDWASAERSLADARALAQRSDLPDAELSYDDGQLALYRGDLAGAERSFTRYLRMLDSAEHASRYDTRLRLAEVYARRGELSRTAQEATSAWDELDRWRASLSDRELRLLAFQASSFEIDPWDASVARVLAALAAGGRASTAFELAERRRARDLSDRLARGAALLAADAHAGTERRPSGTQPVTAAAIVAAIPDDRTAILEYVVGARDAPTTLLVVTRAGVHARLLPPIDSIANEIGRFVSLTESGADARSLARTLGAALLDSAVAMLPSTISNVVVVPDGRLYHVPFDALRLADGRYAVERYAVSVAPSAAVVAALWRRGQVRSTPVAGTVRLLAFGDPAFANRGVADTIVPQQAAAETYRSAFDSAGGLQRLKASGREAKLVARFAPEAEVRLGERASAAYLKRTALENLRVIHFATHALVDERTAARTALALTPGEGETGFVGPGDLAALRLDADLVVLSACRTAGGVVLGGEGIQGLTAPLLQAGARSVVATQWRIGDRSTVTFVERFYRGLAGGLPVAEALRAAKLEAVRRGAPPSEWAAFTAVGDPLVIVPLQIPSRTPSWWFAAFAVVALGAGSAGTYSLRRRRQRS